LLGSPLALALWACADPVKVEVEARDPNFVDLSGGTDSLTPDNGVGEACVTDTQAVEARPDALYVMLDSSGSMDELTAGGSTKWQSVLRATRGFLNETRDSDLSMGLQFFPLSKPGSSFVCDEQSDCGPDGGPCFLSTCLDTPCDVDADCPGDGNSCVGGTCENGSITLCTSDADCPGAGNECVDFGLCENSPPDNPLACILGNACGNGMGQCGDFERTCTNATQCDDAFYQEPAVEIGRISERRDSIDLVLRGHEPEGLTPTAPALRGAINHAREWAIEHPEQTVVTLLATDGLPTPCGDEDMEIPPIQQVIDIASAAAQDQVPVRTFVIGVFQAGDGASINNVNAIAQAGGTGQAVLIDATGAVEDEFLDALRAIQSGTLACEFQVPASETQLDYFKVNLKFDDGSSEQQLPYVTSLAGCAESPNGWHYDVDPRVLEPRALQVCPAACDQFKAATNGSIQLQLGCATVLR
jgi:hypothetical protein